MARITPRIQRVTKPRFQTAAPGDSNGDGVIDENDLRTLRDIIKGNTPQSDGADCNGDGSVNNQDVSCIANQIGGTKNNGKGKDKNEQGLVGAPSGAMISASTSEDLGTLVGTILFAYDESGHLIGEYDELGNRIREYVWLGDKPVAMIQNDGVYYIHSDHLNTPKVVTDSNRQIVWKGDYKPFGEVNEMITTVDMNLRFPGQYEDGEMGLNYNYFRTYDTGVGRYTQSDPVGLEGGLNTFIYAHSNSIAYADPLGLWVKRCSRELGGRDKPATNQSWYNPIRHDYLNVSGDILSFNPKNDSPENIAWGPGAVTTDEAQDKNCKMICSDDKFDEYVKDAAKDTDFLKINAFDIDSDDATR